MPAGASCNSNAQMTGPGSEPLRVAIAALLDAVISSLAGIYDVLNGASMMGLVDPDRPPLRIDIVGERPDPLNLASGVQAEVQAAVEDVGECDIVIVPSVLLPAADWQKGRHSKLTDWSMRMHVQGARICSACSGVFLLTETGQFDGRDATVHFGYAKAFAKPSGQRRRVIRSIAGRNGSIRSSASASALPPER